MKLEACIMFLLPGFCLAQFCCPGSCSDRYLAFSCLARFVHDLFIFRLLPRSQKSSCIKRGASNVSYSRPRPLTYLIGTLNLAYWNPKPIGTLNLPYWNPKPIGTLNLPYWNPKPIGTLYLPYWDPYLPYWDHKPTQITISTRCQNER